MQLECAVRRATRPGLRARWLQRSVDVLPRAARRARQVSRRDLEEVGAVRGLRWVIGYRCRWFGHRDRAPVTASRCGHRLVVRRANSVDLVGEDEERNLESFENADEDAGLRLYALDRRDHEHRAVEDGESSLDLCNEVRVAGSVDQVDLYVTDRERDDSRTDRDTALAFERVGVGGGFAVFDTPDVADDPVSKRRRSVRVVLPAST